MPTHDLGARLDRLESHYSLPAPGVDPVAYQTWVTSLSDDDIDFMAGIAEHVRDGGALDDLDDVALNRIIAVCGTFESGG